MVGHIFITSLVQSDRGVFNMSGVGEALISLLRNSPRPDGSLPALYGDAIYVPRPCIISPYLDADDRDGRVNMRMSPIRIYVEHLFRDKNTFQHFFRHSARMRLLFDGNMVRKIIIVSFFLLNCYYCLYNTSGRNFDLPAVSLESYLPLDEVLPEGV